MNKVKTIVRIGVPEAKRVFRIYVQELKQDGSKRMLSFQVEDQSETFEAEDLKAKLVSAMRSLTPERQMKKAMKVAKQFKSGRFGKKMKFGAKRWTKTEENTVLKAVNKDGFNRKTVKSLAKELTRTKQSIYQRIKALQRSGKVELIIK